MAGLDASSLQEAMYTNPHNHSHLEDNYFSQSTYWQGSGSWAETRGLLGIPPEHSEDMERISSKALIQAQA